MEVSIQEEILRVVQDEKRAGWLAVGEFDVDSDDDLDFLVAHEYLSEKDADGRERAAFLVYFNEGGKYFFSPSVSHIPLFFSGIDTRRIREGGISKAFLYTVPKPRRYTIAVWFEKADGLTSTHRVMKFPEMAPVEGRSLSDVLENYRRMSLKEARRFYGGDDPGEAPPALSGKEDMDEKASHAQKGGSAKDEVDKNKSRILAILIVLGSLGLAVVIVLYRWRGR